MLLMGITLAELRIDSKLQKCCLGMLSGLKCINLTPETKFTQQHIYTGSNDITHAIVYVQTKAGIPTERWLRID